ncbi:NusG domain II-containing protein [Paenibacillus motobuensis]|jgi:hypothetical protein|uniref:NusG domain-containing protein n=1 Tax=Paenibacillus motobuensis TaxID=295324 RepID=A0ABN0XVN7_9BACL
MKRGDLLLIGLVVIIALAFIIPRWFDRDASEKNHNELRTAKITVDGKLFKEVTLTQEEQTIEVENEHGLNILKVHDYGIEMIDADCPDKVCLSFGFVDRTGGTIICLPHKLMVEIEGPSEEDGIDATVK